MHFIGLFIVTTATLGWAQINLIQDANFSQHSADQQMPADYSVNGDAHYRYLADSHRAVAESGVTFESGLASNSLALRHGSVSQEVTAMNTTQGRWFRFSFRGLPQDNFSVEGNNLFIQVEYLAGSKFYDGKIKRIYDLVQQQRRDLATNGDSHHGGAATWHTYQLDFMLPDPTIDRVRLSVKFDHGNASTTNQSQFFVTDFSLIHIDGPTLETVGDTTATANRPANLIPIGGRWFYKPDPQHPTVPAIFNYTNADRLIYHDNAWSAPFAGCMTSYLRAGNKTLDGTIASHDQFVPDNVTVSFDSTSMIIHTKGLPNHPTGKFPQEGFGNPNYIQEQSATYYIPLNPKENPSHKVTAQDNSNHALNMGPIGIAVNGVVFFNPFDASSMDASNFMDFCCGHPNPDGLYHYHKYPICINSPWADEGKTHSPLIGWAFDGFPIYGPYVRDGVLAKDATGTDALNDFNMHSDPDRGWHYQVTPGKFPYIIGGYWGTPDARDIGPRFRGPPPDGGMDGPPGPPPFGFGPP
jgi:hypothetical protein